MCLLIKGGRVVSPANKIDEQLDILVEGEIIKDIAPDIVAEEEIIPPASGGVL